MKIVFATNNMNKLSEIKLLFHDKIEVLSLKDINCLEELPETHPTIKENALQKARFIFENYGFNCFADDTCLEIDSLGGEPGVFSARYAGIHSNATDNINKVLAKLVGKQNRLAKFRTVIALITDGNEMTFEGICDGVITDTVKGNEGFGYDPIFIPSGHKVTFAEMNKSKKSEISHRGKAVRKLVDFLIK